MGRPNKSARPKAPPGFLFDTDEPEKDPRHQTMLDGLAAGMTMEEAAKHVGVHANTLYRWCRQDPDLAVRAMKAKEWADDMVEAVTFLLCMDPNPANNALRMFWLRARREETYRETTKQIIDDTRKSYDVANTPDTL